MRSYSVRERARVLQLAPDTTRRYNPGRVRTSRRERVPRREELPLLLPGFDRVRTSARAARREDPKKRHPPARSRDCGRNLPEAMPRSGLAISAVGDHRRVREGRRAGRQTAASILLGMSESAERSVLHVVSKGRPWARSARAGDRDWLAGLNLESSARTLALSAYRHADGQRTTHKRRGWTNWGRTAHERGRTDEAIPG